MEGTAGEIVGAGAGAVAAGEGVLAVSLGFDLDVGGAAEAYNRERLMVGVELVSEHTWALVEDSRAIYQSMNGAAISK